MLIVKQVIETNGKVYKERSSV